MTLPGAMATTSTCPSTRHLSTASELGGMQRPSGRAAFACAACLLCVLWAVVGATAADPASGTDSATDADSAIATDDPGPGDDVRIEGSVSGVDGDPAADAAVIVGESATLRERSTDGLRALAAADPPNVTVVRPDHDGAFATTVGWDRADAAVAVSDRGVSELRVLGHENATLALRLHERRPQVVFAHFGSVSHGERRGDLLVSLVNNGEATIRRLWVTVTSLPAGWSVAAVRGDGQYHSANRTLEWASVPPGEEVDTMVVVSVPVTATSREYTVGLEAVSTTHPVTVENETVEVLASETPGPTTAPPRTEGTEHTGAPARTGSAGPTGGSEPSGTVGARTNATADGFGVVATAGAAVAAAAIVAFGCRPRE